MARIEKPDILWSVNKLARVVTEWTKSCDKRLARLISYIHHTCEHRQYCYVRDTAQQCGLGLFQDSDFAGDLEDSKSTSVGILCIFGSRTFVPRSWMSKKQTSVSHSSAEAEAGIPVLDLWDFMIEILHSVPNGIEQPKLQGDVAGYQAKHAQPHPMQAHQRQWLLRLPSPLHRLIQ